MRTVILGGTFNPVHNGHLYIGEEIKKQCNYEQILYIPSSIPPHKNTTSSTTPSQRLHMLKLALEGNEAKVMDYEIKRGGVSYTLDTVKYLYRNFDITGTLGLVIGDDLLADFRKWYKWEELLRQIDLIVVHRNSEGEIFSDIPHRWIKNILLPLSSGEIRRRIKQKLAFRYLLPEEVFFYIKDHNLYLE